MTKEGFAPLRKVVDVVRVATIIDGKVSRCTWKNIRGIRPVRLSNWELYECGHFALTKSDIYGDYYAKRRRCDQCLSPRKHDPDLFTVIWDDAARKKYGTKKDV